MQREKFLPLGKRAFLFRLLISFLGFIITLLTRYSELIVVSPIPCLFLSLAYLFYTLLSHLLSTRLNPKYYLQYVLVTALFDGVSIMVFIHYSGGPLSLAIALYPLAIFLFASFGFEGYPYLIALTYFLLYFFLLLGEYKGFVPLYHFGGQFTWPVQEGLALVFHSTLAVFLLLLASSFFSNNFIKLVNLEKRSAKALQEGTLYLTQAIGNREEILKRILRMAMEVVGADSSSLIGFEDETWGFLFWENIDDDIIKKIGDEFRVNPPGIWR